MILVFFSHDLVFQLRTPALCEEVVEPVGQVEYGEDERENEPGKEGMNGYTLG